MTDRIRFLARAGALLGAVALGAMGTFVALRGWPAAVSRAHGSASVASSAPEVDDLQTEENGLIYVPSARQQMIGVRTEKAATRELGGAIRTVGTLAYDETRVSQIHTKISGWIEKLYVDFAGKPVQKGQPLFTIYSPDLVATEHEYLLARKAESELAASQVDETRRSAASLLTAARTRLALWDVSDAQINELERTGEPRRTLTLYSPANGVVLEKNGVSGQYVTPEMSVFKLADLSTVWAIGQVAESEAATLRVGQRATVELSNTAGIAPIAGRVSFIYPDVDPATRRLRVRVDVPNGSLALKPDMFVTITLQTGGARGLAVPAEAVIDTGDKRYVIVAREGGYFEPRPIEAGPAAGEYVPVLAGLSEGETVVSSAQFLIDSETNLRSAMQAMSATPASVPAHSHAVTAAPETSPDVNIAFRTVPAPARTGQNTFEAMVKDGNNRPIPDASVAVNLFMPPMPSMGMPAMRSAASLEGAGGGTYRGVGHLPMAGRWSVTVTVTKGGARLASKQLVLMAR